MSCSGNTTWCAPIRSRMRPWWALVALAQMSATSRSTSSEVTRMLSSRWSPMATTARWKSPTPSCRNASMSVQSAVTACVSCEDRSCTVRLTLSIASTSVPCRSSSRAIALPNRPSPMTTTGSWCVSANDRPLLGPLIVARTLAQGQRRRQRERPQPAHEHQHDEHHLSSRRELRGDPRREPDRTERGEDLEEHAFEVLVAHPEHDERGRHREADTEQGHGQCLALVGARDPATTDVHVAFPAHLRPQDRRQQPEGRDLDAPGGTAAAAADEHEHVGGQPALRGHR